MRLITLIGALAILGAASATYAGSISYNTDTYAGGSTIGLTTTNWDTTAPPPNALVLPKWDPAALGLAPWTQLTGIAINLRGDGEFSYKIENISALTGSSGSNELVVNVDFTLPCGACAGGVVVSSGPLAINLSAFDGAIDFAGTSGTDFGIIGGSTSDAVNIGNAFWGFYTGVGDFAINVAAGSGSNRNISGGDLLESTTWKAGAWAEVIYSYSDVPAPAPLALLGIGMLGLALRRRAKQ